MRKFLIYFLLFVISPVLGNAKVDYDVNNVSIKGDSTLMNMKITSSYFADGAFLIETTGARYEYVPGELKVYQGLGSNKRLLATVTFDQSVSFKKVVDTNEQVLFWSEKLNAGICADSTCMLAVKTDVSFDVTGNFVPLQITEGNPLLMADDTGSIGISNTANYTAKVTSSKLKNWSVSYTLKANQVLTFSVGNQNIVTPVLVLPSYQRVLQDETSVTGSTHAEIFCAKNETESFQVLVANKSTAPLPDVHIDVAEWQAIVPGFKAPTITLFREHYVKVDQPSYQLKSKQGMYPDALIPFIDPYTNKPITNAKYLADHATVQPKTSQGYWIDIAVGQEIPAGSYTTNLTITSAGATIAQIPVLLHVWDFTLPAKHSWTAWFCGLRDLNSVYGMTFGTPDYDTLIHRHQTLLYQHGIYPNVRKHPRINWDTGDVTFTPEYVASLRAFINEYGTGVLFIPRLTTKDPRALTKYLAAYDAFSRANPWAGQYFFYIDEPSTLEMYNYVKQCGDIIHAYAPSVKLLVTIDNPPKSPTWPNLENAIDIYVLFFGMATPANIQKYQGLNKDVWVYTALTKTGLAWELDSDLLNYRIPVWCSYALGAKGILYWSTTVWATAHGSLPYGGLPASDPWQTALTYRNSAGYEYMGEGSLLYPGMPAGIQGPISSMRLKVFRDSVEDYDYFFLLEQLTGRTNVLALTKQAVSDFGTYSRDPDDYIKTRAAIAQKILEIKHK
ncbi:MAG: glycoside hydrolase domain-containing protein [Sedimentisphaerales bacterium]|jgi:hypothetical protein